MSSNPVVSQRVRWTAAIIDVLLDDQPSTRRALTTATDAIETARWQHACAPFARQLSRLALSPIEIDALWILVCCELEPPLARVLRSASGGDGAAIDVALVQRAVAIATDLDVDDSLIANLARHGLVETSVSADLPVYQRPIRATDRVLMLARGVTELDRGVAAVATLRDADELGARRHALPPSLVAGFDRGAALVVHGAAGLGRRTLLCALASRVNRGVLEVQVATLPTDATLDRYLRAVIREARLFDAVPLFVTDHTSISPAIERAIHDVNGPVLVVSDKPLVFSERPTVNHEITVLSSVERRAIWSAHLTGASSQLIEGIADSYAVSPATIVAAAASTLTAVDGDPSRLSFSTIHASLRAGMDERLASLATRVHVTQSWSDLVLPTEKQDLLLELLGRVRYRNQVLDQWGFAHKVGRGTGLSALFSGPPGTGKTMVAGLVANELGLDLYQVDLARVVSKYIGETEKNLASLFDAAESGHAVLLFDEADSLFAKRSDVKSSNDRYANQEVNFLLQRIERFRGITLLTTNYERSLDEALRRRLSIHIRFEAPDEAQRALLWRAMLPELAPVAPDIDFVALARAFQLAGGYIRNAVVRAAYLAAHEGTPIATTHLLRSARAELEAMGRVSFAEAHLP